MILVSLVIIVISYTSLITIRDVHEKNKAKINTALVFLLLSTYNHISTFIYIPILFLAIASSLLYRYNRISEKGLMISLDIITYISAGYAISSILMIFGINWK